MGSPTTPKHGLNGNLYVFRKNGFKGTGLNDATWGTGYNGVASAYYEVVIDGVGAPNSFKWRKNGGAWTTLVNITGAAQTLDSSQTITFTATTGHTVGDQWAIGNLKDEACTESGVEAQITLPARRIINPNVSPTFTDSGAQKVLQIDYSRGWAKFDGNVTIVTVTGNNGFILESGLQQVGFLRGLVLNIGVDAADISRMGQKWKEFLAGQASFTGSIEKMFIGQFNLFEQLVSTTKFFLMQLFTYDPDQDQTGDHLNMWTVFNSFGLNTIISDAVLENIGFQGHGALSFTADT